MADFNSEEYAWSDIEIQLKGRKLTGARGIKYKSSQEKELIHASGSEPRGIGRGNKKYEGTLTLLQSEVQALEKAAGKGKDIFDLRNLTMVVSYAPENGGTISSDAIEYMEFQDNEKGMKQGDKYGEIALSFIAIKIRKNI
jgi:hypothetical protein